MADAETGLMIQLGSVQLRLLGDRAAYWPAQQTLLIADLHLGKGDAFRRAGIAVPSGGTAHDLQRLSDLITQTTAERVLVLGDLIHGPVPSDAHWRAQWSDFLAAHRELHFEAVLGNHDRALRATDRFERLQLLPEGIERDGLRLCHEPEQAAGSAAAVCGHLHPVLRLRQPGLPARLPVFWQTGTNLVLPAFSAFTGGFPVQPKGGDSVWLCSPGGLIAVPAAAAPRQRPLER